MIPDKYLYMSSRQASQALITRILGEMENEPGRSFTIALSGGATPAVLFEVWEREFAAQTPWNRLRFYWVDERCVPPIDVQSNFGLANRLLFSKLKSTPLHYYRIVGEGIPDKEAIAYASLVKDTVSTIDGVPVFDFVLLGVGEDGHTSSIFPNQKKLLTVPEAYSVGVNPYNQTIRICMTGKPMIAANHTCFLVTGTNKLNILKKMLDKEMQDVYPASYVWHHARMPELYASF